MKVLAIIDSFKGTIKSSQLGQITKNILSNNGVECDYFPISDGGDGFLDSIMYSVGKKLNLKRVFFITKDPLYRDIKCSYLCNENTAFLEMAETSGINLLDKSELNPFIANTYGFGLLIKEVVNKNIKKLVIGIGGSATNDGGSGMLEALGVKFYNEYNELIINMNNSKLSEIYRIDYSSLDYFKDIEITLLTDVENNLLGNNGATYIFSVQKGAKQEDLPILENNMKNFFLKSNKTDFNGAGAAGGLGFALVSFMNARVSLGIKYLLDSIQYEKIINYYDYIITGEGKVDEQSLDGKVVFEISKRSINKKIIIVCALCDIDEATLKEKSIYNLYSIVPKYASKEESIKNPLIYYEKLCNSIYHDIVK